MSYVVGTELDSGATKMEKAGVAFLDFGCLSVPSLLNLDPRESPVISGVAEGMNR